MSDVNNERKRRSLETVLPVSWKPKAVRLSMPARTMASIEEEEGQKDQKTKNVTTRRPVRGRSIFVATPIAEESEEVSEESEDSEMPEIKKMEPENRKMWRKWRWRRRVKIRTGRRKPIQNDWIPQKMKMKMKNLKMHSF